MLCGDRLLLRSGRELVSDVRKQVGRRVSTSSGFFSRIFARPALPEVLLEPAKWRETCVRRCCASIASRQLSFIPRDGFGMYNFNVPADILNRSSV